MSSGRGVISRGVQIGEFFPQEFKSEISSHRNSSRGFLTTGVQVGKFFLHKYRKGSSSYRNSGGRVLPQEFR